MAFARDVPVFTFSPELAFFNMQAKRCGCPEASLHTQHSRVSQEATGSCTLQQCGLEKEILCFQTQKEDSLPGQQVACVWLRAAESARLLQAVPSGAAAPAPVRLGVFCCHNSSGVSFLHAALLCCVTNYSGESKSSEGLQMIFQELLCIPCLLRVVFVISCEW